MIFLLKSLSLVIHKMQVNGYQHSENQNKHIQATKLIGVTPDDILRSYEARRSVCDQRTVMKKESDFPVCLILWITGNNVINNVQFLAQTDRFTSWDLNISSGATCIHFVLPVVLVATDLHFMNHQGPQFQLKILFTVLLKIFFYLYLGWPAGE